ncbi:MAG: histidine triad nucleotide-binding protein [Acidobacteriota bacterium]
MNDCLFCKISSGEIPTEFLYEDDKVVAFRDIDPQGPFHILVIPKEHFTSIKDIKDESLIGHLFKTGNRIAAENKIENFRYIINTGEEAGQTVFHVHLHLIGGRRMTWPPG